MGPILGGVRYLIRRLTPWVRLVVAHMPALMLAMAETRLTGPAVEVAAWAALALAVLPTFFLLLFRSWKRASGPAILITHLAGLGWLYYLVPRPGGDWFLHFAQAMLMVAPVLQAASYAMTQTGVMLMRHARSIGRQFKDRRKWPADLNACRGLSEVKAFREALQFDASPALALLKEHKPEVRLVALAALEFRKYWRTGQPETVLALLHREVVPEVRAAAVNALANVDDRRLVEAVSDSLRDPDPLVRRAAADALFWNADRRWNWIRYGVRRALGEPIHAGDGSLLTEGQKLTPEAVKDFTAWAAEKGVLSLRATQTLATHYFRSLQEKPEATLPTLYQTVQDPHAPPLLRIELAELLCKTKDLDLRTLETLIDPANPAPLRLLAAEALLDSGPHIRAIGSLREIAKLPNRELSLATADVIQRRLGIDLGLAIGQPLPALNSPRAIDITRRLMAWAACDDYAENALDNTFATTAKHNRLAGR